MIIRNAAKCKNCGDVVESTSVHHFAPCKCHNESRYLIDNYPGKKYTKNGELTQAYWKYINKTSTGIFVDGGKEYLRRGGNFSHFEDLSAEK